jgi:hypothetical protein
MEYSQTRHREAVDRWCPWIDRIWRLWLCDLGPGQAPARLEENIKNAEQIHSEAIALVHERWYRGYRLLDELAQAPAPLPGHEDRLRDVLKTYDDVLTRWNVDDATLLSRIEMSVDSALGNAGPVSLRDISKIDCHNPFFRDSFGKELPELDHLSVKTWHIGMSHCFGQLNDAIKDTRPY